MKVSKIIKPTLSGDELQMAVSFGWIYELVHLIFVPYFTGCVIIAFLEHFNITLEIHYVFSFKPIF